MTGWTRPHDVVPQEGWRALAPWIGWVLGPAAWALHQFAGYALVPVTCTIGSYWPIHLLTVGCVTVAAAGLIASVLLLRRTRRLEDTRSVGRIRLQSLIGLAICIAAVAGISLEYVGGLLIDPCLGVR